MCLPFIGHIGMAEYMLARRTFRQMLLRINRRWTKKGWTTKVFLNDITAPVYTEIIKMVMNRWHKSDKRSVIRWNNDNFYAYFKYLLYGLDRSRTMTIFSLTRAIVTWLQLFILHLRCCSRCALLLLLHRCPMIKNELIGEHYTWSALKYRLRPIHIYVREHKTKKSINTLIRYGSQLLLQEKKKKTNHNGNTIGPWEMFRKYRKFQ